MLEALTALGLTLVGGTLGGAMMADSPEEDDAVDRPENMNPDHAQNAEPDHDPSDTLVLPDMAGSSARFDAFDPERDQVVVVFPDAMGAAGIADLTFDYDEDRDETHVTLRTPNGPSPVCCLAEVAPGEMDAGNFDFISAHDAEATLGPLSHPAPNAV
ncbi:hypothetical protein FIU97_17615 [Roseivivax sp. THAF40]|uniref:hypothetical protein n=1 Tax=unclassified Roseivivax TaxID=2639302 RepID=UPI0012687C35|nr:MULTISPECIES: hypothetical protein [unclassified Roseivivax]QFS84580.1 hypothetical protein FIV09_17205 [Roseivivax sp. THAF197b]QFT48407.1 hypothetical protein FIU97_17615 [Roseivivax sp. THAF40]